MLPRHFRCCCCCPPATGMLDTLPSPISLPPPPLLQVEADIKPFRGLLLGLFFTTTGGSIDLQV